MEESKQLRDAAQLSSVVEDINFTYYQKGLCQYICFKRYYSLDY
jgi:hypothetical protein